MANALDPDGANATYIPNHNAYVNLYDRLFEQKSVPNPLGNGLTAAIETVPIPEMRPDLKQIIEENK